MTPQAHRNYAARTALIMRQRRTFVTEKEKCRRLHHLQPPRSVRCRMVEVVWLGALQVWCKVGRAPARQCGARRQAMAYARLLPRLSRRQRVCYAAGVAERGAPGCGVMRMVRSGRLAGAA